MNKIELLDISLLNNKDVLERIDHWLEIFNWTNGWHYDLDIIWILKQLEENNIKAGDTILDAGAGLGMMQFILASMGYNIISLDFTDREIPKRSRGIFDIKNVKSDLNGMTHEYMTYMTYGKNKFNLLNTLILGIKGISHPIKAMKYIIKNFHTNNSYKKELRKEHINFGNITFLRGTFNSIPLKDKSVDALISISAFEHNTFDDMKSSVEEFSRVLKDDKYMFVTTSAKDKTWYQEASKGWCFDKETLCDFFQIPFENSKFDYESKKDNIINSQILYNRLGDYYKDSRNQTIPNGDFRNIEYIPVGIKREKFV